jgi:hypothetical protein
MPIVTQSPLLPRTQSRTWSIAAFAAEARRRQAARLDDRGAALADGRQEDVLVPGVVVDQSLTGWPSIVAKR